ncbi:hypothetical protein P167DRAFT_609652, partial [Morchella conica CCBAS932]
ARSQPPPLRPARRPPHRPKLWHPAHRLGTLPEFSVSVSVSVSVSLPITATTATETPPQPPHRHKPQPHSHPPPSAACPRPASRPASPRRRHILLICPAAHNFCWLHDQKTHCSPRHHAAADVPTTARTRHHVPARHTGKIGRVGLGVGVNADPRCGSCAQPESAAGAAAEVNGCRGSLFIRVYSWCGAGCRTLI